MILKGICGRVHFARDHNLVLQPFYTKVVLVETIQDNLSILLDIVKLKVFQLRRDWCDSIILVCCLCKPFYRFHRIDIITDSSPSFSISHLGNSFFSKRREYITPRSMLGPLFSRFYIPFYSILEILRDPLAMFMHESKTELRYGITLYLLFVQNPSNIVMSTV